jgi:hypothetical protein
MVVDCTVQSTVWAGLIDLFTDNDSLKLCHGFHSWSLSSWRPTFDPRPVHVGFVLGKEALGQVIFSCAVIPMLCTHSFVYQSNYTIFATDSIMK